VLSLSNPGQAIAAHLDDSLADMPQEIGFGRGAHHGVMTSADRGQRPMRSVQLIFRLYIRWASSLSERSLPTSFIVLWEGKIASVARILTSKWPPSAPSSEKTRSLRQTARATLLGRRHVAPAAAPAFAARVRLAHMRRQLAGQREQGYVARASGGEEATRGACRVDRHRYGTATCCPLPLTAVVSYVSNRVDVVSHVSNHDTSDQTRHAAPCFGYQGHAETPIGAG